MTCPAFGAANEAGRKFCGECGEKLLHPCPECGSPNTPGRLDRVAGAPSAAVA